MVGILLLSAFLRLYDLDGESLWLDETMTIYLVESGPKTVITDFFVQGRIACFPGYFVAVSAWTQLFGVTAFSVRLLSALMGILSVALIFKIGKMLFGDRAALVSAFLMALVEFQVYYAQEARYYGPMAFLCLLSFLAFLYALRAGRRRYLVLMVAANVLLLYLHAHSAFILLAQSVYYLHRRKHHQLRFMPWFWSQAATGAVVVVNMVIVQFVGEPANVTGGLQWISEPGFSDLARTFTGYVLPRRHERAWGEYLFTFAAAGGVLLLGVALSVGLARQRHRPSWGGLDADWRHLLAHRNALWLAGYWLVCPLLLPFVISTLGLPMFIDRYTIAASLALYLLLGAFVVAMQRIVPLTVSVGALLFVLVPGLYHYCVSDIKEQWQEAAAFVTHHETTADVIIFVPSDEHIQERCFTHHYNGELPLCPIENYQDGAAAILDGISACTAGHERYWLVVRMSNSPNNSSVEEVLRQLVSDAVCFRQEQDFTGISVFLFSQ